MDQNNEFRNDSHGTEAEIKAAQVLRESIGRLNIPVHSDTTRNSQLAKIARLIGDDLENGLLVGALDQLKQIPGSKVEISKSSVEPVEVGNGTKTTEEGSISVGQAIIDFSATMQARFGTRLEEQNDVAVKFGERRATHTDRTNSGRLD